LVRFAFLFMLVHENCDKVLKQALVFDTKIAIFGSIFKNRRTPCAQLRRASTRTPSGFALPSAGACAPKRGAARAHDPPRVLLQTHTNAQSTYGPNLTT
jgi:hypothetical protein